MQIARKRNPSCKVQPVKTKVSSECHSRLEHPKEFYRRILLASESQAISEHPPSILRAYSEKFPRSSQVCPEARVSPWASFPAHLVSSHASSCVSSCISKSRDSRGLFGKCMRNLRIIRNIWHTRNPWRLRNIQKIRNTPNIQNIRSI